MSLKQLILVPFLALTPVLAGCGADCEDICERENDDCDENRNCSDTCGDVEELNDKAGCEDEWDETVECVDDSDDICRDDICTGETNAWLTCIGKYCSNHVGASECTIDF